MKKASKFFNFSNFSKFFLIFALVFTVGLVPTVAKASTTQGFTGSASVNIEFLEYGKWVPALSSIPVATNKNLSFNTTVLDQVNDYSFSNMRFVFKFDSSYSLNATSKAISFIFSSSTRTSQEIGNGTYGFNIYNVNSVYARILTLDGNYKTVPVSFESYTYPSGTSRLDCSILYSDPFSYCEIIAEFNYYNAFNLPNTATLGKSFSADIAFYMGNNTYWSLDSSSIPSVGSPDINDFPDIDEYLPGEDNSYMVVFSQFTAIPFVTTSLFIVSIVGVVSYVLFGRKS